jgi:hypothetical protein
MGQNLNCKFQQLRFANSWIPKEQDMAGFPEACFLADIFGRPSYNA